MNKYLAGILMLVPSLVLAAQQPLPEWQYSIRPGDTLIGVSASYLQQPADWLKLQRYNKVADAQRLPPGGKLRIPYAWLRQQPASAEVLLVSGQVQVMLPGQAAAPLVAGTKLNVGSEVSTAANSTAVLVFADKSRLVVQPQSQIKLDTVSVYAGGGMADTRIRLQQGRAEIFANPLRQTGNRLEVITPSAIAAVRGTVFRVAVEEKRMRQETLEGQVSVSAAAVEVAVGRAMGTLAEQGKAPLAPVALSAAPDMSSLPAKFDRYPLRFTLPAQAGVESWQAQIAPDAKFERILLEKQARGAVLAFAELPDGNYTMRLRGIDAQGLQGLDGIYGFEVDAHPFPPILAQPGDQASVRNPRPQLKWTQSVEAEKYRIQFAQDAKFGEGLMEVVLDAVDMQVAKELNPGKYYWRVASISPNGELGPYSDVRGFEYKPLPGAPELNASTLEFDEQHMHMALPKLPAGQHYEIVLAKDQKLAQAIWQGKPDGTLLKIPKPEPGKYFLGARAAEADGTAGPYAGQAIEVPKKPIWPYLLLLAPLLLL